MSIAFLTRTTQDGQRLWDLFAAVEWDKLTDAPLRSVCAPLLADGRGLDPRKPIQLYFSLEGVQLTRQAREAVRRRERECVPVASFCAREELTHSPATTPPVPGATCSACTLYSSSSPRFPIGSQVSTAPRTWAW